jgi:4-aminobutyrate aminotransferase-like enzyme
VWGVGRAWPTPGAAASSWGLRWSGPTAPRTSPQPGPVCNGLKDRGFLTSNAGAFNNVVKIRPPLVFSQADAEAFLPAFDATLDALHGAG